jgi:putative heme iron utilization protein
VFTFAIEHDEGPVSKREHLPRLRQLLRTHRWAALATLGDEAQPEASMVAYALNEERGEIYMHLSGLASHSNNLRRHPRASLVVAECDGGDNDPQQLARASLFGIVELVEKGSARYEEARQRYLARLPDAEPLFEFADFQLFSFAIERIRFVGGFAQAHSYQAAELLAAKE